MSRIITVEDNIKSIRIDKYLSELMSDYSRSYLEKMITNGKISVNSNNVKPSYKIVAGDEISISDIEITVPDILPENIELDILYEDEDVIVVNKPKGMVVHPDNTYSSGTLVNALMYHCSDLSGINGVLRPGIVHRIDMDTTGSIISCKNDLSHEFIAKQLSEHTLDRTYLAIVHGRIADDEGQINLPIGRDEKNRKKMAVNYKNGKEAITNFTVLERFKDFTYIECRLHTGRTHQIRVHMAHIGHPLLGDELYCNKKCPYPNYVKGQCLHAYKLGFIHPTTQELILTKAPIPEYFKLLLNIIPK